MNTTATDTTELERLVHAQEQDTTSGCAKAPDAWTNGLSSANAMARSWLAPSPREHRRSIMLTSWCAWTRKLASLP
jgi:hypothetical protein